MKTIIGLSGLKGAGKSTVARILCEKYGFVEYAFADPLKKGIMEMFGLSNYQLYGSLDDKERVDEYWKVSPRVLMQVIGTDLIRNYLPTKLPTVNNVWIRTMERKINESTFPRIVISDCRFLDEACMIRNLNGSIIQINRPSIVSVDTHESERVAFESDYTIYNSGTIEQLEHCVSNIIINTVI
jgi:hypothetical protein